ncbi:MAG: ankyrin repeat domain-containing protein, partial [Planctomycetaceae bacterium]|nr:ankyrin repeat domain-containing protein [Planctomycetaceae bacterium]
RKGLKQYAPFIDLTPANAGRFLDYHFKSSRPFGGRHQPTQWGGLHICTNAASKFQNLDVLEGYERLTQSLLTALVDRFPKSNRDEIRQLVDFIADRCGDVRDQIQAQSRERQSAQDELAKQWTELFALRKEVESQQALLQEREQVIQQEWKRFQQERAEFEQLRQQWEEQLEEITDHSQQREQLANERETLAIEKAALNSQRQQLEADQSEWEKTRKSTGPSPDVMAELEQEKAKLADERRKLEEERAELWNEREEISALREQLLTEQNRPEEEEHILFEPDLPAAHPDEDAAVMTTEDANQLLVSGVVAGDVEQAQAALKWGANPNQASTANGFETPLHTAARKGHIKILETLLDAGADAEQTDAESLTPLESAIINEQPSTCRLLVQRAPKVVSVAYPLLLKIMRDPKSPEISRQLCVEAVGTLQREATDSIPTLLNLLESEFRELGKAAAETLGQIDPDVLTTQAIPYVSYILNGPLAKKETTNSHWLSNLYAVRGDLNRLAGCLPEASADYESAVALADPDHQQSLRELLEQTESNASETQPSNSN